MKKYLFSLILTGVLGIYSEVLADAEKETAGIVDDGYVGQLAGNASRPYMKTRFALSAAKLLFVRKSKVLKMVFAV